MLCAIKGLSVYYTEYGQGMPVLCIHGYEVDHRIMSGCLEPIFSETSGYRRIYLDLPGMGKTAAADWIINADAMLELIVEFVRKVIKDENFLLAGESYGGYLSLGLIREMREKILGVLLICPVVIADINKRVLPTRNTIWNDEKAFEQYKGDPALEEYLNMAVVAMPTMFERYKADVLPGVKAGNKKFLSKFNATGYAFTLEEELQALVFDGPACILTGRQDDIAGFRDAMMLLAGFTRSTFAVLDSAGHNLQIESEDVFEAHVNDWLWRVDAGLNLIETDLDTEICANCGYEDAVYDTKISAKNNTDVYTCENCGCSYSRNKKTFDLIYHKGKKLNWEEYLQSKLTFPFTCVISEYQEDGILQQGDELVAHGVVGEDDLYGVLFNTRKGRKKYIFPACDLEIKGSDDENAKIMHNYAVWFANCR